LIVLNFQWKNCSIFKNNCTIGPNITKKPLWCTLTNQRLFNGTKNIVGALWFGWQTNQIKTNKSHFLIDRFAIHFLLVYPPLMITQCFTITRALLYQSLKSSSITWWPSWKLENKWQPTSCKPINKIPSWLIRAKRWFNHGVLFK